MKKLQIIIGVIIIGFIGFWGYGFLTKQSSNTPNVAEYDPAMIPQVNSPSSLPKVFPVDKLPAFAATDCQERGGKVVETIEKGVSLEKCVFKTEEE